METAKVDIQKLQLLNDRLAQTIDALHQLRMSAHTTQPSATHPSQWGYGGYPTQFGVVPQYWPYSASIGASPYVGSPYPVQFGASPFVGGFQHTTAPFAPSPYVSGFQPTTPFTASPYASFQPTTPFTASPYASFQPTTPYGNGISHSSWDPSWQMRAAQSMPFMQQSWPLS